MKILNEFAESKKVVLQTLRNYRSKYIEHMLMIFIWRTSTYVRGWMKEVYSFYRDVDKVKNTKKFPSSSDVYAAIFGGAEDSLETKIDKLYDSILFDKPELMYTEYNLKNFISFIKAYSLWLSYKLSTEGSVSHKDVVEKLTELLSEYEVN